MPYKSPYTEFEFGEIAGKAMEMYGLNYNSAHDLMDPFRVDAPEWDIRHYDFDISEMNDQNYNADEKAFAVMRALMEEHGPTIRILK